MIASTERIVPTTAHLGSNPYPDDAMARIRSAGYRLQEVDAPALAAQAGNPRTAGTCLLAALSWHLDVPEAVWDRALHDAFPQKILDVNLRAYALARAATEPAPH